MRNCLFEKVVADSNQEPGTKKKLIEVCAEYANLSV